MSKDHSTYSGELKAGIRAGGGYLIGLTTEQGVVYANIVAPKQYELTGLLIDGAATSDPGNLLRSALSRTDSRGNTEIIAPQSAVARQVLALDIDGYSDWAIPAVDVQEMIVRYFMPKPHASREDNAYIVTSGQNGSSLPNGFPYLDQQPGITSVEAFVEYGNEAFQLETFYTTSTAFQPGAQDVTAYYWGFDTATVMDLEPINHCPVRPVRRMPYKA
jgi:hypothetical protein